MPALEAFGVKLKLSGDDLVFPYASSIFFKCLWFIAAGITLIDYDREYMCHDDRLLKLFLLVQLGIQLLMVVLECIGLFISTRGTIANPNPRRHLKWILYTQVVWFIVELIWTIVGVQWVFDPMTDCAVSHHVLILARIVSVWNLLASLLVLLYFVLRFGFIKLFFAMTPDQLKYEHAPPKIDFSGRRLSSLSEESLAQHHRQRSWQWRIQNLFFFLRLQDRQKSIFAAVSATLSDAFTKFRGYVPTDILAGMALLKMQQELERRQSSLLYNPADPITRIPLNFSQKGALDHYNKATRYMLFAMGAYGSPLLVYSNHIIGLVALIKRTIHCCFRRKEHRTDKLDRVILGDSLLKWNLYSITAWTGINEVDIIHANFKSDVFCPSYYVALDHKTSNVVISVRGTLSMMDALTDLSAQPQVMMIKDGVKFYVHEGMLNTANILHIKLEGDGVLQRIFRSYPSYHLIVTGHSLGAGVAALLAILLKPEYPCLHCFAFSPPGGLVNLPAVHHTRSFITSIVVGNDLVPRLSLQNFEKLSDRILEQLRQSTDPKYLIFIKSFFNWCGLYKLHHTERAWFDFFNRANRQKSKVFRKKSSTIDLQSMPQLLSEESLFFNDDHYDDGRDYGHIVIDPITGKSTISSPRERPSLYIPGKILHLTRGPLLPTFFGLRWYHPVSIEWTVQSEFNEIMLDQDMVSDHLPDKVYQTMMDLAKQQYV